MRTLGIVSFLLLAATGGASAQAGQSETNTVISVVPLDDALDREETVVLPIHVIYTYTFGLATRPTEIDLVIETMPPWLVGVVSPATVSVNPMNTADLPNSFGVGKQARAIAHLTLAVTKDAPPSALAGVRIAAVAHENGDLRGSAGADELLVRTAAFEAVPACDLGTAATAPAASTPAGDDGAAGEVETQSAAFAPAATPVIGVLGLAGAAAGGVYAMRRRAAQ
ncbi:MAG TPA: hypothetical protein VI997_09410 [Candidatus Thermoplasmatota archaeon]|nr:hypothetical protein [Candidatus Thermoplasmatota archaeon]